MTGTHLVVELSGCDAQMLGDAAQVQAALLAAAHAGRAHVLHVFVHQFQPTGVSGIVALAESHLSIHTWPERAYAAVDVYTCGHHPLPHVAATVLSQRLHAQHTHVREIRRGIAHSEGCYVSEAMPSSR